MIKTKLLFQDDYLFKGKQRDEAVALSELVIDKNSNSQIFSSSIELYMTAALVGCYYGKRVKPDKGETRRIMAAQFISRYRDLQFIYQLVMLSNDSISDANERINNAFRNYDKKENAELFDEYVLGGLSILYNKFFPAEKSIENSAYDDYVDRLLMLLFEFKENDIKNEEEGENFD